MYVMERFNDNYEVESSKIKLFFKNLCKHPILK